MNWKIALVITDYVSGAPVPGVVVTAASSGSAGIGTTDASGAASLVIVVREQSPFLIIGVPSPPAATGAFTTWNMALVLTDYTGIPLAGIDVYLDGGRTCKPTSPAKRP